MKRLRSLLIAWLCASLALMGALAAVLPVLQLEHRLEHTTLDDQGTTLAIAHDADSHSHDDRSVDLLSQLGELLGTAGALASVLPSTAMSASLVSPSAFDTAWRDAASPSGTADPPDRPPQLLA